MFRDLKILLMIGLSVVWLNPIPCQPAATSFQGGIEWPMSYKWLATTPAQTSKNLTSNNTLLFQSAVQAPKTGSIHKIGYWFTTTNTTNTINVGLYTVSASSPVPTDVNYGGSVNGTHVMASGDANTWVWTTLGTDATATQGDVFSCVIRSVNGPASAQLLFKEMSTVIANHFPFSSDSSNSGASWTNRSSLPQIAFQYSDGSYAFAPGVFPITTLTAQTFSNASTQEYAMAFCPQFAATVKGFALETTQSNNYIAYLYAVGGSTTALVTVSSAAYASGAAGYTEYISSNPTVLTIGTTYYLSIKPTSAETTTIYTFSTSTDATTNIMGQLEGGSTVWMTSRTASGPWSNMFNQRIMMSVILGNFDDGVGSGSGGSQKVWGGPGG